MERPSSMAATIVAKLSSASTMSAASLATSVPAMPIATPMAACLSAGASLTPSPVMAGTSPAVRSILTSICLSRGSVREKTMFWWCDVSSATRFSSDMPKKSAPVNERPSVASPSLKMPISRAIASAVGWVSPVIITTRMPAVTHSAMAGATSGRAGSLMPATPTKVIPCSRSTKVEGSRSFLCAGCASPSYVASSPTSSLTANARQRSGRAAIWATVARIALRSAALSSTTSPFLRRACVQRSSTRSGAPLTYNLLTPEPPPVAAAPLERRRRDPPGVPPGERERPGEEERPRVDSPAAAEV
mmetsp:Transcript_9645/g.24918  ORF Transcript_9645/g.24918 Transcript_9645/m.24918 type:complete len:303 (+) Transcript_9645:842-1750(+)